MNLPLHAAEAFSRRGYLALPGFLAEHELRQLADQYGLLEARAKEILRTVRDESVGLADFYRTHPGELIVVPERDDPRSVCRFEYVAGSLPAFRQHHVEKIRRRIGELLGEDFVLFKDKCNVKSPGGGGFSAHQDIAAYDSFGPSYHVTAALALDAATLENGCLEVAVNYRDMAERAREIRPTGFGDLPLFDSHRGGPRNGDIVDEIQAALVWQPVEMNPGDVLLFDSYLPHRSAVNHSATARRVFFLTFNPSRYGDRYAAYYMKKSADYGNPVFHVSTPTRHDSAGQETAREFKQ
ncbi:MAG: phytanoyl-CoA dioxygenase family protein [Ramlibacter sp.]|nr:phytanoyl-CoA dioxygenase family protein [Ramlibacter sp.]